MPTAWQGREIALFLERCHWQSTVWIDDQRVGTQNSLSTAHRYPVTPYLAPGKHTITVRIDNRIDPDIGQNSYSITDHTQTNWNGIIGRIMLESKPSTYFTDVQLYPDAASASVEVRGTIHRRADGPSALSVAVRARGKDFAEALPEQTFTVPASAEQTDFAFTYSLGQPVRRWDEFEANLYQLSLRIQDGEERHEDFGFREVAFQNRRLRINGRPSYLRGTLECAIFPETGYPAMDEAAWKKIYATLRAHGLNHLRFHSWCPPEAAFTAADALGIYLQVEAASWANYSTTLGDGQPVDSFVRQESERIVRAYGNHPSFLVMAYGNEPSGDHYQEFLASYVRRWKEQDNRRLYTSAAGWPELPENDFHVLPQPRIQGWGEGLNSVINARPPATNYDFADKMPADTTAVIAHEIGQWCAYPDFKEIDRYTGVLRAKNFELFRKILEAQQLGELAEDFLMASGKLQALCYKADIEAALRTPNQAGFQLLDLHDFPGQGTALVGVLNAFWEEKGYISPEAYRRFCNTTVPLARFDQRVFREGETVRVPIEIAHFGQSALSSVTPTWSLTDTASNVVAEGRLRPRDIALGNGIPLGSVSHTFSTLHKPRKLVLEVRVDTFSNHWDAWVYPENKVASPGAVKHVIALDATTLQELRAGAKVLLSLGKGTVASDRGGAVGVGFSSIFWNTAWTKNQKPHTLGILCDPQHPAMRQFPTEFHSNWQWWDAMSHCDVIDLNALSSDIQPIVRVIDDWVTNRSLGLLFEVTVGAGKLLISGVDLTHQMEERPEAEQLLTSLIRYMESEAFQPPVALSEEQVLSIRK